MRAADPAARILSEVSVVLAGVSRTATERFLDRLLGADQIFIAARGRTGLVAGAFAMRLMHLGLRVFIVGGITTPKIGPRDLLVACSGSGAARTVSQMISIARRARAAIAFLSYTPSSPTARAATVFIRIPTSNLRARGTARHTVQPLGSLFEQALFVYLDSVVLRLMERLRVPADDMAARHTNLE